MNPGNGQDEETPTEGIAIGHPDNRHILGFLGNDILELREHTRIIQTLYEAIRGMTFPVGLRVASQLVDEYERHQTSTAINVASLKTAVGTTL